MVYRNRAWTRKDNGGGMSNYTAFDWLIWLLNWSPLLLMLGLLAVMMRKMVGANGAIQQQLTARKRHYEVLEKILASHEARLQKIEDDKRG
jgi:hypothetical protein